MTPQLADALTFLLGAVAPSIIIATKFYFGSWRSGDSQRDRPE